jgi:hypothetical protein
VHACMCRSSCFGTLRCPSECLPTAPLYCPRSFALGSLLLAVLMVAKPFVFIYVLAVAIHMVTNSRERNHMTVSWVALLLV